MSCYNQRVVIWCLFLSYLIITVTSQDTTPSMGLRVSSRETTISTPVCSTAGKLAVNTTGRCEYDIVKPKEALWCECSKIKTYDKCQGHFTSPPLNVRASTKYDKTTRKLTLTVHWAEPEYGLSYHFGYEIDLVSIDNNCKHHGCYKLNRQVLNITFPEVCWGSRYSIKVYSLPRSSSLPGSTILITTPDRQCQTSADLGLDLPFHCFEVEDFHLLKNDEKNCSGQNATVRWSPPKENFTFDDYSLRYKNVGGFRGKHLSIPKNNIYIMLQGDKASFYSILKTDLSATIGPLTYNVEYKVEIKFYRSDDDGHAKTSVVLVTCKPDLKNPVPSTSTRKVQSKFSPLVIGMIGLVALVILLVGLVGVVCFRKAFKAIPKASSNDKLISPNQRPVVFVVYCQGCGLVENLAVLLASILNEQGITVHLDLLEQIDLNRVGQALYLETHHRESDYVLFICTQKYDSLLSCHNSFDFMVKLCRNAKLQNMPSAQSIAVHLEQNQSSISDYVPICLQEICYKCYDQLERMISNIHGISTIRLENDAVVLQSVSVNMKKKNVLDKAIKLVLQKEHSDCYVETCSKGQIKKLDSQSRTFATSLQSFDSHDERQSLQSFDV